MSLLGDALSLENISSFTNESIYSIDNAVNKLKTDKIITMDDGKVELVRTIDSFISVCRKILDSEKYNEFLQSSYCKRCLDTTVIKHIGNRFYTEFDEKEYEELIKILNISKSALSFSLFGDTKDFLVTHEHIKKHCLMGEEKRYLEESLKNGYKKGIFMALLNDINNHRITDKIWYSDKNLNFIYVKLKISLGSQREIYLDINSYYDMARIKAEGSIKAGEPISISGSRYSFDLQFALFMCQIREFQTANRIFSSLSKQVTENEMLATIFINWGILFISTNKLIKAIGKFDAAVELLEKTNNDALKSLAHLNLAVCYNNLCEKKKKNGYKEKAIKNCKKAISLNPDNEKAMNLLEYIKSSKGS